MSREGRQLPSEREPAVIVTGDPTPRAPLGHAGGVPGIRVTGHTADEGGTTAVIILTDENPSPVTRRARTGAGTTPTGSRAPRCRTPPCARPGPCAPRGRPPARVPSPFPPRERRGRRRHPSRRPRCQPGQRPARHTGMAQTGMRRPLRRWLPYASWALVYAAAAAAGFWLVVYAAHQAG
jgi:hypothetical protein